MSIELAIQDACAHQTLFQLFAGGGRRNKREVYASQRVHEFITTTHRWKTQAAHAARLRNDFRHFLLGLRLTVGFPAPNKKAAMMKLLIPTSRQIWEFRSYDSGSSGIRVFGRMAAKDVFIALGFEERFWLGEWGSPFWRFRMWQCEWEWRIRFPEHEPLTRSDINDYFSNAKPI